MVANKTFIIKNDKIHPCVINGICKKKEKIPTATTLSCVYQGL